MSANDPKQTLERWRSSVPAVNTTAPFGIDSLPTEKTKADAIKAEIVRLEETLDAIENSTTCNKQTFSFFSYKIPFKE